jgi:hypothetical protein
MENLKLAVTLLLFGGLYTFLFVGPLTVLLMIFLTRIPKQHRQISVYRLCMLAVPLVHIVWLYFAVTRVSTSFQQHLAAGGKQGQGDCGYALGLAMVIAVWAMAAAPMITYLLRWEDHIDVAVVACGLTVFALFGSYVLRLLNAARALT